MKESLCSSAAAAALSTAVQPAAQEAGSSARQTVKKHTGRAFLALCEDFRTAKIELETEVFSGFDMIVLLLDEIEGFLQRRGTIRQVLNLLSARGLVLSELTLKK